MASIGAIADGESGSSVRGKLNAAIAEANKVDAKQDASKLGDAAFADILGTVSQSGGVPTGAVIERGSNDDGEYVKFADGTLICHASNVICIYSTAASLVYSEPYPAGFTSLSSLLVSLVSPYSFNGTGYTSAEIADGFTRPLLRDFGDPLTQVSFNINRSATTRSWASGDTLRANYTAIGRWF